jgi:cytidylate kinase
MDEKYILTIGRQLGSGGRQIGEQLASRLGIAFYDKELIQIASQESGLGKEFFEKVDEKKSHSLFGGQFPFLGTWTDEYYSTNYLSNETLFQIQSDVIRKLAEKQSAVFVGRCADYVLKDHPRCLNIFISAHIQDRIKRIAELQHIPEKKALDMIEKTDKKRASYYNYYSNKIWGNAGSYDLCVNSSFWGIDLTISFIHQLVKQKFGV